MDILLVSYTRELHNDNENISNKRHNAINMSGTWLITDTFRKYEKVNWFDYIAMYSSYCRNIF